MRWWREFNNKKWKWSRFDFSRDLVKAKIITQTMTLKLSLHVFSYFLFSRCVRVNTNTNICFLFDALAFEYKHPAQVQLSIAYVCTDRPTNHFCYWQARMTVWFACDFVSIHNRPASKWNWFHKSNEFTCIFFVNTFWLAHIFSPFQNWYFTFWLSESIFAQFVCLCFFFRVRLRNRDQSN